MLSLGDDPELPMLDFSLGKPHSLRHDNTTAFPTAHSRFEHAILTKVIQNQTMDIAKASYVVAHKDVELGLSVVRSQIGERAASVTATQHGFREPAIGRQFRVDSRGDGCGLSHEKAISVANAG